MSALRVIDCRWLAVAVVVPVVDDMEVRCGR